MSDVLLEKINNKPNSSDWDTLSTNMLAYHASKGHVRKTEEYSILLRDQERHLVGAVVVTFLWNGMEINSLWVDESLRGQGWGKKLMELAEEEGKKRGCTIAYTNTFTWQAPDFYKKLGYQQYGRLDDFPPNNSLIYYVKKLA